MRPSPRRLCQAASLALFCYLLFCVAWPYSGPFTSTLVSDKEVVPAESFLRMDPLVAVSTAVAGRRWHVSLLWSAGVLALCLFVPRGFCGYICPLGTTIDLFDWAIGARVTRLRVLRRGPWAYTKYYLLIAVLVAAALGVLLSGYVAAMPIATRGFVFVFGSIQLALLKHSEMADLLSWERVLAAVLFLGVLGLGFLGGRFWCRYCCPSGGFLSLLSWFRLYERQVTPSCTRCGRCRKVCPFDAIRQDFSTRPLDCAFCRTCADVCLGGAIVFARRQRASEQAATSDEPRVTRRALLGAAASGAGAALGVSSGIFDWAKRESRPLRPPGAVQEDLFLNLCVRCGECIKVCPGPVLHPAGLEAGLEALWTPIVVPKAAGCHYLCHSCGQVCPTGAIRPLSIKDKRRARIGLAVVHRRICLPHTGERDCQLCFEECRAAGYNAITMKEIQLRLGDVPEGVMSASELEEAGRIWAPFVDPAACVGCGLCEFRCHNVWVKQRQVLPKSAIVVAANSPS